MYSKSRSLSIALFLSILSSTSYAEADKGWRFFAGMDDDFKHESTLSLLAGGFGADSKIGDIGMAYGLELSLNCPMIQPPTNKIRQQLSYLQYDDGETTIKMYEINPHYVVEVSPDFWIGGGPGIGYVQANVNKKKTNMFAGQLGASMHYSINKVFIGGEARYQFTQSNKVGGVVNGANNWRAIVKLGYNFY